MSKWISVNERLPKEEKIYLVKTGYAHSSYLPDYDMPYNGQNLIVKGIAFATFKLNYKKHWSIERSPSNWATYGGRVTHWAYLPEEDKDD